MSHALAYDPWPPVWDEAAVAALPEDGHRYEIYDGALLVSPPANWDHQGVEFTVAVALHQAAPPGWRVLTDLGIDCGDNKLVPDVAVVRAGASKHNKQYGPARDVALVVEVESPSTRMNDRNAKLASYAQAGIESYWRVERTSAGWVVVVYQLADDSYQQLHRLEPGRSATLTAPYLLEFVNDLD